ncbi:MAG: hypothetical protein HEP71_15620 [Roseivirga sp.]|nr:hypothetical protein [Roseivirga sp.]
MKKLLLLVFAILALNARAQRLDENRLELNLWHPGEVTLQDGRVVKGKINFNYVIDMIRVQSDGQLNTFNHKQILEFQVFKEEEDRIVYYKSLNLPIGHKIYEVVGEDAEKALLVTTVIDREAQTEYTNLGFYNPRYRYNALPPTPGTPGTRTYTVSRKAESFFIIRNTGKIDEIGTIVITRNNSRGQLKSTIKRKKLIKILKEYDPNIEQYLETNDIDLRRRKELIKAILSVMDTGE